MRMSHKSWIEKTFSKRECVQIIPSSKEPHRCVPGCQICQQLVRCCCGRLVGQHACSTGNPGMSFSDVYLGADPNQESERWTVENHTVKSSTDAFGTISFQGGSHGYKAKYVRLSNDSKTEDILQLMVKEWRMALPKLVISVHGGMQKFPLHCSIKETLSRGFVKAAVTTGAWIITGGVNNGVAEHIGDALKEGASRVSHKICTVGIAPWGVIESRNDLLGKNVVTPYQSLLNPLSKLHVLNSIHSHFLLVDDGTVGKYGEEVHVRRKLENQISLQQFDARIGRRVPLVALILEGGPNVILTVLEYLQRSPAVPVVVCEGSGRAADLLAYVYKQTDRRGNLPEGAESDITATIQKTFNLYKSEAVHLFQTLMACMGTKDLITVFHVRSEKHQDIDVAILTALLKGTNASLNDQLVLALAWDRVDIAKKHIFVHGQQWMMGPLEQAMLDALVMDRVSFVKLLIENGVAMHRFLTIQRLEELYNMKQDGSNATLLYLIQDVKKGNLPKGYKITLIDVGLVIEYLMGGTFRCSYTKKRFRTLYKALSQHSARNAAVSPSLLCENNKSLERAEKKEKTRHGHFIQTAQPYNPKVDMTAREATEKSGRNEILETEDPDTRPFPYPFNELLVWAVLMRRQKMALFFWQHGGESMAKALVARKLYRAMSHEAGQCDVIDDASDKLKEYSKEFGHLAVELLDKSFRQNERMAMKLVTYELNNWSKSTCLKLAVSSRLRLFVAHTCTQMLLSDMWMGRLNMRKNSWYKVILSILLPPIIPMLEYKTRAQMSHIPQSQDDHRMSVENKEEVKFSSEGINLELFKEVTISDGAEVKSEMNEGKPRRLPLARKYYAFYNAPIVKFWFNTLAYLAFLMLYTFVVLVKMESLPSVQEWIVIAFIFSTGVEKIREIFLSEAGKISQKLRVWFSSYLNLSDIVAIITFLVGFGLRFGTRELGNDRDLYEDRVFIVGRLIYCLNIIFWFVRLLDVLNVNQEAGPYVLMIGKMMTKMFFIVVIMAVVVISFGVPRQAILYPQETPSWSFAKGIVFQPYWMTYGEMYAYEVDVCANNSVVPQLCGPGTWLTPFLQAVYVFVQYIIMVNLLIAIFNNVYRQGKAMSTILWKFQRYHFIMVYHDKLVLPPPLILFSHVSCFISWMCGRRKNKPRGPKLFLTEEDQKKIHDFEEQCVKMYFIDKNDRNNSKSDERIRVTSERVEHLDNEMKEVGDHVSFIRRSLRSLDHHIGHLQDLSGLTLDTLKTLTAQKALESSRSLSAMSGDLSLSRNTVDDGLGQSTMWKKSSSDHIWGRSFSQPSLERVTHQRAPKSQRNRNISEGGPIGGAVFQRGDSLPEFQEETRVEENNMWCYRQKPKSLKSRPSPATLTAQSSLAQAVSKKQMRSEVKVTKAFHCKNVLEQHFSPCPQAADSSCLASGETSEKEGYDNCGFIDDTGNTIDIDENTIKDKDVESHFKSLVNQSDRTPSPPLAHHVSATGSTTCDGDAMREISTREESMDGQTADRIKSECGGNTFTGIFQKLWTKSKYPGGKHHVEKQIPIETNSSDVEAHPEAENNRNQTDSCTELTGFQETSPQASTNQSQIDNTGSTYEDWGEIDSKAALLKEPYYSRYSSSYNKSPLQKDALNGIASPFIPSMDITFYYSAIERNNLFRLSQSVPFTPLPPRGELVTVYRLEESSPNILNNSMSSWSQQGVFAKIEFLGREEMGGGLRRAVKVACTWSEYDILKSGHLYIIKSFLPEVVNTWSGIYKEDTVLQLCLREIQQQRAAQKLLFAFNQMKPKSIPHSPKFLEVFLLYCHSAGQWFTVEEYMAGRFRKCNNNTGNENVPTNKLEKTMLAFSHWTYEYTRGEFLVLDLQGVGENLTDPSVIKAGERRSQDMVFGPANLGDDAIKKLLCQTPMQYLLQESETSRSKKERLYPDRGRLPDESSLFYIPPVCSTEGSKQPIRMML